MASISSYLPSPGSNIWRRDVRDSVGSGDVGLGNKVRHVMIKGAEIRKDPSPYVMYRIEVLTEHDHWYLYHRYRHFHTLHQKLVKLHGLSHDLLPPKRYHGNLSKSVIDERRLQLESYLQKLIHNEQRISQSDELTTFLDVPAHDIIKVTDILTHYLYHHGDQLLIDATPILLSVNEMYSITKRLTLPCDAKGVDPTDPAGDPANLYSFLHQLRSLRVAPPASPTSVCCMPFDLCHFRSLHTLKLDQVPLSQVCGLLSLQQQLRRVSIRRSLRSLRELLIEAVEEKRPFNVSGSPSLQCSNLEKWRLTAMAKLTENRVVVQPWHSMHTLNLAHNGITYLDDSLLLLPALKELNLSNNTLQLLDVHCLCLPSLEKLNLSHNAISKILNAKKVLENVTHLNLSHNRLHSLNGISCFMSVTALNLDFNLVASMKDLDRLLQLRSMTLLCIQGNPISEANNARIFLLAKFLYKSKNIKLDGQHATPKEQTKIQSYRDHYGTNPDHWPLMKAVITSLSSSSSSSEEGTDERKGKYEIPESFMQTRNRLYHPSVSPSNESDRQGHIPHLESRQSQFLMPITCLGADPAPQHDPMIGTPGEPLHQSMASVDEQNIRSTKSYAQPLVSPSLHSSQLHHFAGQGLLNMENEEKYSIGSLHWSESNPQPPFSSRDEPDGQFEASVMTPLNISPLEVPSDPPSLSFTTPPPTPLGANGNYMPQVTPGMIQSALEALQGIENKETPLSLTHHENPPAPILSEAVTSALTAWINQQNDSQSGRETPFVSPPPSTPLDMSANVPGRMISASELITALSSLTVHNMNTGGGFSEYVEISGRGRKGGEQKVGERRSRGEREENGGRMETVETQSRGDSSDMGNGDNFNSCTVPSSTPQEGISEWFKLGIRPEDVIQALSALTIQERVEEQSAVLSPINEEQPHFFACDELKSMHAPCLVKCVLEGSKDKEKKDMQNGEINGGKTKKQVEEEDKKVEEEKERGQKERGQRSTDRSIANLSPTSDSDNPLYSPETDSVKQEAASLITVDEEVTMIFEKDSYSLPSSTVGGKRLAEAEIKAVRCTLPAEPPLKCTRANEKRQLDSH